MSGTNIETLDARMAGLLEALDSHPMVATSPPNPAGVYILDFIRTSHKKLKSLDAYKLQSGDQNAHAELQDIQGHNVLAGQLINGGGPMAQRMAMMGGPVDFVRRLGKRLRRSVLSSLSSR
ncbi:hypothetical protein BDV23DRAFT_145530 [Aspergillus alliaceus]|uniref:Uncharacterized protein n=1 Tax=Petromyces alliaceus TaxID=209559 RepID=A0A5N7CP24_PETAA|nr:hypothetical protein BDV23DRAFT_145530 [Aspergillus alliaceus]